MKVTDSLSRAALQDNTHEISDKEMNYLVHFVMSFLPINLHLEYNAIYFIFSLVFLFCFVLFCFFHFEDLLWFLHDCVWLILEPADTWKMVQLLRIRGQNKAKGNRKENMIRENSVLTKHVNICNKRGLNCNVK